MILADRARSATFAQALRRSSVKNARFFALLIVSVLLGCLWLWLGLAAMGGFMLGLAVGAGACMLGMIKRFVAHRPMVEEFVDWKKVEEAAGLP